jgi:hypothetical protein
VQPIKYVIFMIITANNFNVSATISVFLPVIFKILSPESCKPENTI